MSTPRTINPDSTSPRKIGGEDTNPDGLAAIQQFIAGTGDSILHHTTFDFGIKVLALTYQLDFVQKLDTWRNRRTSCCGWPTEILHCRG